MESYSVALDNTAIAVASPTPVNMSVAVRLLPLIGLPTVEHLLVHGLFACLASLLVFPQCSLADHHPGLQMINDAFDDALDIMPKRVHVLPHGTNCAHRQSVVASLWHPSAAVSTILYRGAQDCAGFGTAPLPSHGGVPVA